MRYNTILRYIVYFNILLSENRVTVKLTKTFLQDLTKTFPKTSEYTREKKVFISARVITNTSVKSMTKHRYNTYEYVAIHGALFNYQN